MALTQVKPLRPVAHRSCTDHAQVMHRAVHVEVMRICVPWIWELCDSGWSGAELANLLQEAALVAVRRGQREVDAEDVAVAAERLILGAPRTRLTEEQRLQPELVHRMAVREAGLALTAVLLRCRDREEHRQRQKAQALAGSEGGHREGLVAAQESTWQPAIEAPQRVSIMARGEVRVRLMGWESSCTVCTWWQAGVLKECSLCCCCPFLPFLPFLHLLHFLNLLRVLPVLSRVER